MSAYRYLVFSKHQQPTADEAAELQGYSDLLKRRFAIGKERKSESLVFAFEQDVFDHSMANEEGFELLIRKWQVHGCELVGKLKFVKDPDALRPTHARVHERRISQDKILVAKKYLVQEAVARSLLGVQKSLKHYKFLQQLGRLMPYALIAVGTIGVIVSGLYISGRMKNPYRERRKETIERVSNDAMVESLDAETAATNQ